MLLLQVMLIYCVCVDCVFHLLLLAEDAASLTVTWLTFAPVTAPIVQYSFHSSSPTLGLSTDGFSSNFTDGKILRYVHRVTLKDLKELTGYGMSIYS